MIFRCNLLYQQYSFQDEKSKYQKTYSILFAILVERWIYLNNGGRSRFSLKATSPETISWTKRKGGRGWQASGFGTLPPWIASRCVLTIVLEDYVLYFSPAISGRSCDRPEKLAMQQGNEKASGLLHMLLSLPGFFFQTKSSWIWSTWVLSLILKSLVSENNSPHVAKVGMCLSPL